MKTRPVFSIDRRCSAAMRRIAAFIDEQAEIEKARIASDFQQLRRARACLRSCLRRGSTT